MSTLSAQPGTMNSIINAGSQLSINPTSPAPLRCPPPTEYRQASIETEIQWTRIVISIMTLGSSVIYMDKLAHITSTNGTEQEWGAFITFCKCSWRFCVAAAIGHICLVSYFILQVFPGLGVILFILDTTSIAIAYAFHSFYKWITKDTIIEAGLYIESVSPPMSEVQKFGALLSLPLTVLLFSCMLSHLRWIVPLFI